MDAFEELFAHRRRDVVLDAPVPKVFEATLVPLDHDSAEDWLLVLEDAEVDDLLRQALRSSVVLVVADPDE